MNNPLHVTTLAHMEIEYRACLLFLVDVLIKFGNTEVASASASANSNDTDLLRVLTPLLKLYTGKKSVQMASESIEAIGGTGYMEDSHIPLLLRNSQVHFFTFFFQNFLLVLRSYHFIRLKVFGKELRMFFPTMFGDLLEKTNNPSTFSSKKFPVKFPLNPTTLSQKNSRHLSNPLTLPSKK